MAKNQPVESTQEHLSIAQIRDDTIILKDGSIRAVMMTSCVNFALKSEQEQNAIVFSYQNFLNSLNFPIQIVMRSKKIDLEHYLKDLDERAKVAPNELLRIQIIDYTAFIRRLITIANIMDKKFFVVIPFFPPSYQKYGTISNITGPKQKEIKISEPDFQNFRKALEERVNVISAGLGSCGIRAEKLTTQQIIELFYEIYNPEEGPAQKLAQATELQAKVVKKAPEKK